MSKDTKDTSDIAINTAIDVVELATPVFIPFVQFLPLIKDVADIFDKVAELYRTAQHNKNITKILMQRISTANSAVTMLRAREDLFTSIYYSSLQRLVQVLQDMKKYIGKITQYNTVQKFIAAKTIEKGFKDLCEEYDSSIILLHLNLTVDFKFNAKEEEKILKEDIEELLNFQDALRESMDDVKNKVVNTNDKMNLVVERVSEMAITMQILMDDKKGPVDQTKIDNIFHESLLPFNNYEEGGELRTDKLKKYVHIKTREEFAFKTVVAMNEQDTNRVKNQVTILKKLRDCQNIINFFGLTNDDNGKYFYLVTEWAENGNLREYISKNGQDIEIRLRIRIAYDIAKGLNFLNSVKVVHRAISSENIVITDHEVAKITNFKLSRTFSDATNNLALDKECVRYSAPEILRRGVGAEKADNKTKYDTKCEVYSFGVLLWEIAECRIPYEDEKFKDLDFIEIAKKVVNGHREKFTLVTVIPEKYQTLVNKALDPNPGIRPIFSKILTDLQEIFKNYTSTSRSNSVNSVSSNRPFTPPVRKMTSSTIAAAAEDCIIDFDSFNYMEIDKAVEEHKKNNMEKSILYKCFDTYANMGNARAKYWKAYYISKGWSDLKCSQNEKDKISAELFKAAADYGDDMPDAQLRYGTMVMQGKGVKLDVDEAMEYFLRAAKNDHVVAMFNVATYNFSKGKEELGKYYMIKAAEKKYGKAIDYCKTNNIPC